MFETSRRDVLTAGALAVTSAVLPKAMSLSPVPGVPPVTETGGLSPGQKPARDPDTLGTPLPLDERVGYAILGLGEYATEQILPSFAQSSRSRLSALVTSDRAKGERYAAQYGLPNDAVYTYDEIARLRANPKVQAVYIITPNATHLPFTEAVASAGKHVLSEKPMETDADRCRKMIEACRKAGVKLMVGYRAQYEPFNEECIRLCRSGEMGTIKLMTSEHGRQLEPDKRRDVWRQKRALAGGGSLFDIGIYALNAAMYLTGEVPVELSAHIHSDPNDPRFREVEDTVAARLTFPSGAIANLASGYSWNETKRYSVVGSKKTLNLDPATDYYKHDLQLVDKSGTMKPDIAESSQFARELDHFSQAIQQGTEMKTPGEMGLRDVKLMTMIYESARSGRPLTIRAEDLR